MRALSIPILFALVLGVTATAAVRHQRQTMMFEGDVDGPQDAGASILKVASADADSGDDIETSPAIQRNSSKSMVLMRMPIQDSVDAVNSRSAHGLEAYAMTSALMACIIVAMFYPMGPVVVMQVILYIGCLALVKIGMKCVYEYGFDYPKFVTALHLLTSSLAGFSVLTYRKYALGVNIAVPTLEELSYGILPIALVFGLSIGCENTALVYVSAAFSEVVAASTPAVSAFLLWATGMPFNFKLLAPIALVILGCTVSVSGEMSFSLVGFLLLLLSVVCRSLKAVMQQKLMTGETKDKFDPVTLLAWTCGMSFFELLLYSITVEGTAPIKHLVNASNLSGLLCAIAGSSVIACALNISALFVIKQLGAVGMQIVSQMKSLLVVIGGVALLSESFTYIQQVGFVVVLSGVFWYSRMKMRLDPAAKPH